MNILDENFNNKCICEKVYIDKLNYCKIGNRVSILWWDWNGWRDGLIWLEIYKYIERVYNVKISIY